MQTKEKKYTGVTRNVMFHHASGNAKNRTASKQKHDNREGFTSLTFPNSNILNYTFEPIPIFDRDIEGLMNDLTMEERNENINKLYLIVRNYLSRLGKVIKTELTGDILHDLYCLYKELNESVNDCEINICFRENEGFYIVLYFVHEVETAFYHLPICVIAKLSAPVQNLFKKFINVYMSTQGIESVMEHMDYSWLITEHLEEQLECYKDENVRDLVKLYEETIETYQKVEILFYEIGRITTNREEVISQCDELLGTGLLEMDFEIVKAIKNFAELLGEGRITSFDYDIWSSGCNNKYQNDVDPVTLDRLYAVIWDSSDILTSEAENGLNCCADEYGIQTPTSCLELDLQSELFRFGDYPERFTKCFFDLYELLNNYV